MRTLNKHISPITISVWRVDVNFPCSKANQSPYFRISSTDIEATTYLK
ncbi:hypothetical protein X975_24808, partial [Stegodyphus mimosarum]